MVSDQEIAKTVESVLRQSDPNAVTSLNSVVQQLEAKLGLSLAHKVAFIRDQITFLLRTLPVSKDQLPPQPLPHPKYLTPQPFHQPHFAPYHQANPAYPSPPPPAQAQVKHPQPPRVKEENAAANASETPKGRPPAGTKRRGGPGGLNKICGVSPKLQVIVGQPELPRTEIVRQLWAYIRKHNLQDPENKRKIICDDALRLVFETDCTDMFKMNKLLAKHILPLDPTKESVQAKKSKAEDDCTKQSSDPSLLPVIISDALANFFGTEEKNMLQSEALGRIWEYIKANKLELITWLVQAKKSKAEDDCTKQSSDPSLLPVIISDALANFFGTEEKNMLQSEALGRIWEYIKANKLEDPLSSMVIHCDSKLQELLGCKSISALGIQEMLFRHHLLKQS